MHYGTAFMMIIYILFVSVHSSDEFICSCSCCIDNRCTQTLNNNYTVSTCDSCKSFCQTKFSSTCIKRPGLVSHECINNKQLARSSTTPDWIGVFQVQDGDCDIDECCCLTDLVYFTRGNNNNLRVQGKFIGQCPTPSPVLNNLYTMPNEFHTEMRFFDRTVSVKLTSDSRTMNFLEPANIECRYKAVRENHASLNTINWTFVILLSSMMSTKKLLM